MYHNNSQQLSDLAQIQLSQTAVDLQLKHFRGEAFSDNEKQSYLSFIKILAVLFTVLSFPITGLAVYYYSIINIFFFILLMISGASMTLLGIALFEWAAGTSLRIFKNQNSVQKSQLASNRFSQYIFISSITVALLNTIIILYLYNWVQDSENTYSAKFGPSKLDAFKQNYHVAMFITWCLLVINQAVLFICVYYEYIITIGLFDLRLAAHFCNVLLTGFSLVCIHACKKAQSYFTMHGMDEYANKKTLDFVYLISLSTVGVSLFNYVIIVRKKRQEFMWIGTVLIFICCFLSSFNHLIYRDAQSIFQGYLNTWYYQMPYVSNQYLHDEMQCSKYLTTEIENESVYSLHCDLDYQSLVWEDNYNKKVEDRLYQSACLNQDCRGVLANSFSAWYQRINLLMFCQIASFFLIAAIFYQMSLVINRKKVKMDSTDYFFGFCTLVVTGAVLTYIFSYDFIEPPQLNSGSFSLSTD